MVCNSQVQDIVRFKTLPGKEENTITFWDAGGHKRSHVKSNAYKQAALIEPTLIK